MNRIKRKYTMKMAHRHKRNPLTYSKFNYRTSHGIFEFGILCEAVKRIKDFLVLILLAVSHLGHQLYLNSFIFVQIFRVFLLWLKI